MKEREQFATYPSLRERVVLVTGGATGIGAAVVEEFALQGSRVAFLDIDATASSLLIANLSTRCLHPPVFLQCDLTDIAALRAAVAQVEASHGAVRVLVNNAASDDRHSFSEVTPEYWDGRMAINLRHQFFAIQAVAPRMTAAGGGSIINMSSIGWMIPSTGMPAYVACKAAIVGLTRTDQDDGPRIGKIKYSCEWCIGRCNSYRTSAPPMVDSGIQSRDHGAPGSQKEFGSPGSCAPHPVSSG